MSGQFLREQSSGGDDDRQGHAGGTQFLEQFNARQPGRIVVGDQKIVAVGIKSFPGRVAVFGGGHAVAMLNLTLRCSYWEDVTVTIHHKNAMGGFVPALKWLDVCCGYGKLKEWVHIFGSVLTPLRNHKALPAAKLNQLRLDGEPHDPSGFFSVAGVVNVLDQLAANVSGFFLSLGFMVVE